METLTTDPVAAAKPGESPSTAPKPEEVKAQETKFSPPYPRHPARPDATPDQRAGGGGGAPDRDFARWATPPARGVTWLTRAKKNLKYEAIEVLVQTSAARDRIAWIGEGTTRQQARLIEVQAHGTIYRYLTDALEPARLPTAHAVALYPPRRRGRRFRHRQAVVGLGLFLLRRRKRRRNASVGHLAVVRRVDRLDRRRRRSAGAAAAVREGLRGHGLPQSVFRDERGRPEPRHRLGPLFGRPRPPVGHYQTTSQISAS